MREAIAIVGIALGFSFSIGIAEARIEKSDSKDKSEVGVTAPPVKKPPPQCPGPACPDTEVPPDK
jgi:hypothetical protein